MQDNVGTIVIGTKVNTKGATKDITKLYQQIEREQDKIERLTERKQQLDIDTSKYGAKIDFAIQKTDELGQKIEEIAKKQLEIDNMPINQENIEKAKRYLMNLDISDTASSKQYQDYMRAEQMQQLVAEFDKYENQIVDANSKLDILERKQSRITREIQNSTVKQEELNQKLNEASGERGKGFNIAGFEKGLGKVSDKFSKILKKVGKIALALVGVRTIINLITRSFNTLAQYNEELGTKMEQMRLVLAVGLEPVINWLVSMIHTILSLINQISIALSGINLFGRASELWTKKMSENMGGASKSAKEMKKQLAGFDEMNVLQDNEASGGGGGGGGSNIQPWTLQPEFDWSKFDIHIIMDKLKKLVDDVIKGINDAIKNADPKKLADGISTFIVGLIEIINKTFTDLNWGELISTIIQTILHLDWASILGGLLENIIVTSFIFPIELLLGIIDGILTTVLDFIENPDQFEGSGEKILNSICDGIKKSLSKLLDLVKSIVTKIFKIFGIDVSGATESITFENLGEKAMEGLTKGLEMLKDKAVEVFENLLKAIKNFFGIHSPSKTMEDEIGKPLAQGLIDGIVALKDKIVQTFVNIFNSIKQKFEQFKSFMKELIAIAINWVENKIFEIANNIHQKIEDAKTAFSNIVQFIKDKFNQVTNFFKSIGITIGDAFSGAIKNAVNSAFNWIESKVNAFIRAINSAINVINSLPGVSISRLSTISLPRLAVGGIINQPGRGVPVGGAIAGESGREGILPLTDKRAMEELGREIGKWINIQATVPVYIGNRQVSRVIQEITADREFAMNS